MDIKTEIETLKNTLPENVVLVAVSKTYPAEVIMEAYDAGQRIFGESRPQELKNKYEVLPKDISWHMIGHLQTNKVKYIAPFVSLIHSVDSVKLIETINKEAQKIGRIIDVLMEVRIAAEETKHGWDENELRDYLNSGQAATLGYVRIRGLMGIATYTEDMERVKSEFRTLKTLFDEFAAGVCGRKFDTLSMGMSSDYREAVECGSNMIRIGSMIFGSRK